MEGLLLLVILCLLFSTLTISYSSSPSTTSIITATAAVDTITTTQSLTDGNGNTIVSSGGSFELGFFSPDNSRNRYLGIWYKKITTPTVVWVANRDIPLNMSTTGSTTTGVLNLTDQGILTLLLVNNNNNNTVIIWSSSNSPPPKNPVARLLDSGNLVVIDMDNTNNYLWQSFDYPSDTVLPGMKLGRNIELDRYLWSWKTSDDPSRGDFIFRLNPNGFPQLFLTNASSSADLFRSGPWNGLRFSGSPGLKPNPIYTYHFVFNPQEKEAYYAFDLVNTSVYSRLLLNPNGVLQRFTWNYRTQQWIVYLNAPADNCDFYGRCHAYASCNISNSPVCGCLNKFEPKYPDDWDKADWSNGCVRRKPLDCPNIGDGFLKYSGIKLPDTRYSWYNQTMTLDECHKICLENCSCMAYANSNISESGRGCLLWFGDLIDIREFSETGQDIYIRMASSELEYSTGPQVGSSDSKIRVALGVISGIIVLGLGLTTLYVWKRKKKKKEEKEKQRQQRELFNREGTMEHNSKQRYTNERHKDELELPLLDFATIANATNNFSVNNKLGEGGFGPVYKGKLEEGQEIAVKRLSKYSAQGLHEFKNEVICIAKLQHRNLVKLLGCCIQQEEMMLIYEYMPNNSLDSFIFGKTRSTLLDWPKRFNIINGIARGLLYLHQDSRLRIIHRDLKASNVLLDIDMNPKISDFGMARSFRGNETEANTNRVVGTYGYMSPEYAVDGLFSVKSDVFSFGVLALEIVSGKRNRGFFHPEHHHNLLGHAWMLHNDGRSLQLIDANLGDSCSLSQVLRSIHVGLLCVQQYPEDRPSMSSIVLMLGGEGALPRPKEPGFFTKRNLFFEADYSSSTQA